MSILHTIHDWRQFYIRLRAEAHNYGIWDNIRPGTPEAPRVPWTPMPKMINTVDFPIEKYYPDNEEDTTDPTAPPRMTHAWMEMARLRRREAITDASESNAMAIKVWERESQGQQKVRQWMQKNISDTLLNCCILVASKEEDDGLHIWYDAIAEVVGVNAGGLFEADTHSFHEAMNKLTQDPSPEGTRVWISEWRVAMEVAQAYKLHEAMHSATWWPVFSDKISRTLPEWLEIVEVHWGRKILKNDLPFKEVAESMLFYMQTTQLRSGTKSRSLGGMESAGKQKR